MVEPLLQIKLLDIAIKIAMNSWLDKLYISDSYIWFWNFYIHDHN